MRNVPPPTHPPHLTSHEHAEAEEPPRLRGAGPWPPAPDGERRIPDDRQQALPPLGLSRHVSSDVDSSSSAVSALKSGLSTFTSYSRGALLYPRSVADTPTFLGLYYLLTDIAGVREGVPHGEDQGKVHHRRTYLADQDVWPAAAVAVLNLPVGLMGIILRS